MGSSITYKVVTNFLSKVKIRGAGRVGSRVGKCPRSPGVVLPLPGAQCPNRLRINGWMDGPTLKEKVLIVWSSIYNTKQSSILYLDVKTTTKNIYMDGCADKCVFPL